MLHWEVRKIIFELSSLPTLIWSSVILQVDLWNAVSFCLKQGVNEMLSTISYWYSVELGRLLAETLSVDVNALIFSASQAARLKMDRPFNRFLALSWHAPEIHFFFPKFLVLLETMKNWNLMALWWHQRYNHLFSQSVLTLKHIKVAILWHLWLLLAKTFLKDMGASLELKYMLHL